MKKILPLLLFMMIGSLFSKGQCLTGVTVTKTATQALIAFSDTATYATYELYGADTTGADTTALPQILARSKSNPMVLTPYTMKSAVRYVCKIKAYTPAGVLHCTSNAFQFTSPTFTAPPLSVLPSNLAYKFQADTAYLSWSHTWSTRDTIYLQKGSGTTTATAVSVPYNKSYVIGGETYTWWVTAVGTDGIARKSQKITFTVPLK